MHLFVWVLLVHAIFQMNLVHFISQNTKKLYSILILTIMTLTRQVLRMNE